VQTPGNPKKIGKELDSANCCVIPTRWNQEKQRGKITKRHPSILQKNRENQKRQKAKTEKRKACPPRLLNRVSLKADSRRGAGKNEEKERRNSAPLKQNSRSILHAPRLKEPPSKGGGKTVEECAKLKMKVRLTSGQWGNKEFQRLPPNLKTEPKKERWGGG